MRSLIGHAGCVLALMLAVAATVPAAVRAGCRTAPARHSADFAARGALPVGVRTLHLVDATRVTPPNGAFGGAPSRALDTEVWYPAATAPSDMAVQDAPLDIGGAPYPLVLYGHALQDNRSGEAYLAEHLASRGYVVAAVDFPLGKFGAPGGATPDDLASQPGDLTVVLDHLLAGEDGFGGAIDAERIGASGLSLGAATVLLLTYHQDLRDRRIRAALPIAPPYSCAFTRKFYRHARVPLLVMQGDADGLVPLEENSVRVVRRARGHARSTSSAAAPTSASPASRARSAHPRASTVSAATNSSLRSARTPPSPTCRAGVVRGSWAKPARSLPGVSTTPTLAFARQHELAQIIAAAFFDAYLGWDRGARCWLGHGLAEENPDVVTRRR